MRELVLADQEFIMHPHGILFWPAENLAIVSDLHLEKGSFFASQYYFLPPYDTCQTLQRLEEVLKGSSVSRLLLLGDSFHDRQGFVRMEQEDKKKLNNLLDQYEVIWINGNHDREFIPPGCRPHDSITIRGLTFRHESAGISPEISGHFHPKLSLRHKGSQISRSCFIEDGKRLVMPAFGSYTGGLDVLNPVIVSLFCQDFRVHMTSNEKIYSFSSPSLRSVRA